MYTENTTDTHVVVITMRAILIALLISRHVLSERLLAFLTQEMHLRCFRKLMRLLFGVALWAIEPLLAAWSADGDLRVQDMLAVLKLHVISRW